MLIDRRCEKRLDDRRLILETDLYRAAGQEGREFTGGARLEILEFGRLTGATSRAAGGERRDPAARSGWSAPARARPIS